MSNIFHYAFKVKNIESTRKFYVDILGCEEGRSTETWIDFDFFGNQLSAHIGDVSAKLDYCGKVDGVSVPIPHFGCLLTEAEFRSVQHRLQIANIQFVVKPQTRYEGQSAQQSTMFILDLSGNPIEFKSFKDETKVFDK